MFNWIKRPGFLVLIFTERYSKHTQPCTLKQTSKSKSLVIWLLILFKDILLFINTYAVKRSYRIWPLSLLFNILLKGGFQKFYALEPSSKSTPWSRYNPISLATNIYPWELRQITDSVVIYVSFLLLWVLREHSLCLNPHQSLY